MKLRKTSRRREHAKSKFPATKRQEKSMKETDDLLKEVEKANEHVADPTERERVVPSRPC